MKELNIPVKFYLDITKSYEITKADADANSSEGDWMVEGYAVTQDIDHAGDLITEEAIKGSANDLLKNSTVLRNHNLDEEIGKVIASAPKNKGLWVKVLISKTADTVWTKIKEGVLNKFSVRMKIVKAKRIWEEKKEQFINEISKMHLIEVSLVTVPMNENAKAMRWYVAKALVLNEFNGGDPLEIEVLDKDREKAAKFLLDNAFNLSKSIGLSDIDIKGILDNDGVSNKQNTENFVTKEILTEAIDVALNSINEKITEATKNFVKNDDITKSFNSVEVKANEKINALKLSLDTITESLKGIDLSKYPELLTQFEVLTASFQEAMTGFTKIKDDVKDLNKNLGIGFNEEEDNRKNIWNGAFPNWKKEKNDK